MQITACYTLGTNAICSAAQTFCNNYILGPLAGKFDVTFFLTKPSPQSKLFDSFLQVYYVPTANPDPYPPAFDVYLNKIAPTIGGEVNWTISSDTVYDNFGKTGK